jgi:hypothetical protein
MKRAKKGAAKPDAQPVHPDFVRVANALGRKSGVTRQEKKGFGSGALKVNGKIFAMMDLQERFVLKLPQARVDELVSSGEGEHWEPGPGRMMKEWISIPAGGSDWVGLADEAYRFVKGLH